MSSGALGTMKLGNSLQPPDGYPEHSFDTRTNLVLFFGGLDMSWNKHSVFHLQGQHIFLCSRELLQSQSKTRLMMPYQAENESPAYLRLGTVMWVLLHEEHQTYGSSSSHPPLLGAQSVTKFRHFSFVFPWMLNLIPVLFHTLSFFFFFLNLHGCYFFSIQFNLLQLFHVKSCSNTLFHTRYFNLCLIQ